jgi:hypothetical protein
MAFRNPAAALVQVGLAPGRQVIIDPTVAGQISFPNGTGYGPASIGTTPGSTEDLHIKGADPTTLGDYGGLDLTATTINNNVAAQIFAKAAGGNRVGVGVDVNPGSGSATVGYQGAFSASGFIPGIMNNSQFASLLGTKWLMQVTYHPSTVFGASPATVDLTLPLAFPTGERGAWAWPSAINTNSLVFNAMFPGANHARVRILNLGGAVTTDICLISIALYP